jgi:hypothetical protein
VGVSRKTTTALIPRICMDTVSLEDNCIHAEKARPLANSPAPEGAMTALCPTCAPEGAMTALCPTCICGYLRPSAIPYKARRPQSLWHPSPTFSEQRVVPPTTLRLHPRPRVAVPTSAEFLSCPRLHSRPRVVVPTSAEALAFPQKPSASPVDSRALGYPPPHSDLYAPSPFPARRPSRSLWSRRKLLPAPLSGA